MAKRKNSVGTSHNRRVARQKATSEFPAGAGACCLLLTAYCLLINKAY
jgi:hypothetical protein